MNSLYLYHHNSRMRSFYHQADVAHIDGMALIFLGKLLQLPLLRKHRVTYADWVWSLMREAERQSWRVFYVGSQPGVASKGAMNLRCHFPGLEIQTVHGYFNHQADSPENKQTLEKINQFQPHILMVGMGMPLQEHWILDNLDTIKANNILTCGACIDYVAGVIPTPPRWMGKVGLEWLYRLLSEPKRLWYRYWIGSWFLVKLLVREIWTETLYDKNLNKE